MPLHLALVFATLAMLSCRQLDTARSTIRLLTGAGLRVTTNRRKRSEREPDAPCQKQLPLRRPGIVSGRNCVLLADCAVTATDL
jgi:hypothetical protein